MFNGLMAFHGKFKFSRHLADGILSKTIMPAVNLIYC